MDSQTNTPDLVNHPPHYKAGGIEVIDFIEAKGLNYRLGNVVKYVARADQKGTPLQDLMKARWYLDREIAKRKAEAGATPAQLGAYGRAPVLRPRGTE